jgi:predicted nuclease with TOPRIM domain
MTLDELVAENAMLKERVKLLMDSHNTIYERLEDMEAKLDSLANHAMTRLEDLHDKIDDAEPEQDADWWKQS